MDAVGIVIAKILVWCGGLGEMCLPMESSWSLGIVVCVSGWCRTVLAGGTVISGQEDGWRDVMVV